MIHLVRTRPRVKVCCIKSRKEAALAIACGASALGLVSAMPTGPGVISEDAIAQIAATVPPPIATFLLTSERLPEAIIAQQRHCGTNTLQLCDHLPPEVYPQLRARLPGIALVQVVHVTGPESVDYAIAAANHVDAILLDSGNPKLAAKELGGTGPTATIGDSATAFAIPFPSRFFWLADCIPATSRKPSLPFSLLASMFAPESAPMTISTLPGSAPFLPPFRMKQFSKRVAIRPNLMLQPLCDAEELAGAGSGKTRFNNSCARTSVLPPSRCCICRNG